MATRIHVLLARDEPVALILRRGPTKQVRQLLWNRRTDQITGGQWLAGRVYDERCDLSPNGELLVYFGMRRGHTWTAVSRPPYFTPLAVWEESGTWGGGGVFVGNRRLLLRSNPRCMPLDPKFTLPEGFEVGWVGDQERPSSAWTYREPEPEDRVTPLGTPRAIHRTYTPSIRERVRPGDPSMVLEAHPVEDEDPYGPPDAREYLLRDQQKARVIPLGRLDWADWDVNGDLLHARDGELMRAPMPQRRIEDVVTLCQLADDHFAARPPPPEATEWPASCRGGAHKEKRRRR